MVQVGWWSSDDDEGGTNADTWELAVPIGWWSSDVEGGTNADTWEGPRTTANATAARMRANCT